MSSLTSRQAEAMVSRLVDFGFRKRLDGSLRGRDSAAMSGLYNRLEREGLIVPRGERGSLMPTIDGLDALEANLHKLPAIDPTLGISLDDIRAAIANRRDELDAQQRDAFEEFEEAKAKLRAKREERAALELRVVPGKLDELAQRFGLTIGTGSYPDPDARLVALWRAIVDADGSL